MEIEIILNHKVITLTVIMILWIAAIWGSIEAYHMYKETVDMERDIEIIRLKTKLQC